MRRIHGTLLSQDRTGNNDLLHVACAFIDAQGANFTIKTFNDHALAYAIAAKELHCRIDHPLGGFSRIKLRHGGFSRNSRRTAVLLPGRTINKQSCRINVERHQLQGRITLLESDGLANCPGPWDLVLCNPPYVNAASMADLPAEYRAEPELALASGSDGMDFCRALLRDLPARLSPHGVLVLEIGNERIHFEAAFPHLQPVWLSTSAGDDQVLLLTASDLTATSA